MFRICGLEGKLMSWKVIFIFQYFFNRSDSTIVNPYGKFVMREPPLDEAFVRMSSRPKDIVWFVSNCDAKNKVLFLSLKIFL